MCGITGISLHKEQVNEALLKKATALLHHRGPDSSNIHISNNRKTGFGHTRLSFIDLSDAGSQPMSHPENSITVVLNGEIYNYLELRKELTELGHNFITKTDTEVLIHGFKAWGKDLPKKLEGMFAFAIYDEVNAQLFLARDRFGIKPLYYYKSNDQFIFGSEVKSIIALDPSLKKIRPESISLFLANRYVPTPFTIWHDIYKLKPGSYVSLDLNSFKTEENPYWELKIGEEKISEEDAYEKFRTSLIRSVENHLRSDVPIGSFLSGGLDSSTLVYIMQQELGYSTKAFSIGFENWEQSEDQYAKIVADKVGATLFTSKPDRLDLNSVEKLMWHYDDPIADISIIPTFEVSGLARRQVKAVVSGEGADEALGGYWWHQPESFTSKTYFQKIFSGGAPNFKKIKNHYIHAMSMGLFDHSELKDALTNQFAHSIPKDPFQHFNSFEIEGSMQLKQLQYLDLNTFMPELILNKVDRASMAHSLEVRVPFLQHQLVEDLFNLPQHVYFKKGEQKPFLKKLLKDKVPAEVLNRPKQGFVGPDKYYMEMELYKNALVNGRLVLDGVIKSSYIESKLQQKDHWRLWKLFVLENWWKNWM
jgi:asparagine synthase (glutamine-hydrolysing)